MSLYAGSIITGYPSGGLGDHHCAQLAKYGEAYGLNVALKPLCLLQDHSMSALHSWYIKHVSAYTL